MVWAELLVLILVALLVVAGDVADAAVGRPLWRVLLLRVLLPVLHPLVPVVGAADAAVELADEVGLVRRQDLLPRAHLRAACLRLRLRRRVEVVVEAGAAVMHRTRRRSNAQSSIRARKCPGLIASIKSSRKRT